MAPLAAILEAARERGGQLEAARTTQQADLDVLETEVAAKRQEKGITAQSEVRELLKRREALQQQVKALSGAAGHVEKAVAKLERAAKLGVADWTAVREEQLKLSESAAAHTSGGPGVLEGLRKASGAAELSLRDGALVVVGEAAAVERLRANLAALDATYEAAVAFDDESTLRMFDARGELTRLATKHGVSFVVEGASVRITGLKQEADKMGSMLRFLMLGCEDLDCPKKFVVKAKARAKDVEAETGALIDVLRTGGWEDGGSVCIRGGDECVAEAAEQMQAWLDEAEGASSTFVDVGDLASSMDGATLDEFRNDVWTLGGRFGVAAKDRIASKGQLELRGPEKAVAEGKGELKMVLDFYKQKAADAQKAQAKAKAKAKAKAAPEEDDWGAAPVAEPPPGHAW